MKMIKIMGASLMGLLILLSATTTARAETEFEKELREGDQIFPKIGCDQEGRVRSIDATVPTNVLFENRSQITVHTYWLDYEGKRVLYQEMLPGTSYMQQTYVTHPWIFVNSATGGCMGGILQPESSTTKAIMW